VFVGTTRISKSSVVYKVVSAPVSPNPFSTRATRKIVFCVPDEWYRRSKSRTTSSSSLEPSEETIRRLVSLQESENEDDDDNDGEDTAKLQSRAKATSVSIQSPTDWKGSLSQARLSSMFDGWMRPTSPPTSVQTNAGSLDRRKSIVSEPRLVEQHTAGHMVTPESTHDEESDIDVTAFDAMLVSSISIMSFLYRSHAACRMS
jgi:diaphanous 1